MPIWLHTLFGTGMGWSSAFFLSSFALTRWHTSHRLQYSSKSFVKSFPPVFCTDLQKNQCMIIHVVHYVHAIKGILSNRMKNTSTIIIRPDNLWCITWLLNTKGVKWKFHSLSCAVTSPNQITHNQPFVFGKSSICKAFYFAAFPCKFNCINHMHHA